MPSPHIPIPGVGAPAKSLHSPPLRNSLMFMVGCSLRAVVMQFLTYFRLAGHLIFLPFASALHATVACFTAIFSIWAGVSLTAFATQSFTYFRLAGHLIFFSLAFALHAAVVSFRATFSMLDVLAASAAVDVSAALPKSTVAVMATHKVMAK